jgi:hypothetical protein
MNRFCAVACVGWLLSVGVSARADSVTLFPSQDNTLIESLSGSLSNGSGEFFFAGRTAQPSNSLRRALVQFDISESIPSGATINSVVLTLEMSRTPTNVDWVIELRRTRSAWGEGASDASGEEGNGAPSSPGDASWIHAFFDTQFWPVIGGDFESTVSAAVAVGTVGTYTWGSTPQMIDDVQSWLDNPVGNFGWVLIGDESSLGTAKRFNARENTLVGTRPSLLIEFTPLPPVPATGTWAVIAMFLSLSIMGTVLVHRSLHGRKDGSRGTQHRENMLTQGATRR